MIYGDNHLDRVSKMLDGMADHETSCYLSRQPSASRLFDSFLTFGLTSQDTDLDLLVSSFRANGDPASYANFVTHDLRCSYNASYCFLYSFG